MQVVILAGGKGTRISEETTAIPKPMVRIGNIPIIQHIMNHYASFGHRDFLIAAGYKSDILQNYFQQLQKSGKDLSWDVKVVDTGLETGTAGRILELQKYLESDFFLTYGDGISNVNLTHLLTQHRKSNLLSTITAVRPPARFGSLEIVEGMVTEFREKDPQKVGWINGGFFVMSRKVTEYISDEFEALEGNPLSKLASLLQLGAYLHEGWWQPMDTLRDKLILEEIWNSNNGKWPNT
jgi:glucose-1-phosphate cytidylyltransferase